MVEVVSFRRLEVREVVDGMREVGAAGASDFLLDQMPMVWSAEAERMRCEGWCTAIESMLALWPYSSIWGAREAESLSGDSLYLHTRIVRSRPEETIVVGEMNLAALTDAVWPPFAAEGDVASISDDMFHTRSNPS